MTAPEDTTTSCRTLASMHALETATRPALSTTAGVPLSLEAEAANMTELAPFTAPSMVDTYVTSHFIDSTPTISFLLRYIPCLVHALQDIPRARRAFTHS